MPTSARLASDAGSHSAENSGSFPAVGGFVRHRAANFSSLEALFARRSGRNRPVNLTVSSAFQRSFRSEVGTFGKGGPGAVRKKNVRLASHANGAETGGEARFLMGEGSQQP